MLLQCLDAFLLLVAFTLTFARSLALPLTCRLTCVSPLPQPTNQPTVQVSETKKATPTGPTIGHAGGAAEQVYETPSNPSFWEAVSDPAHFRTLIGTAGGW
jgi:hypothetical protein